MVPTQRTDGVTARTVARNAARTTAIRRVLFIVLGVNAVVTAAKLVIAARTGAVAVLGAGLESGLDMLGNLSGILLVTVAVRAPDDDHPYGHGKFENLGMLAVVGFLSISCFELLRGGVAALVHGEAPRQASTLDLAVLAGTLGLNLGVVLYERRRGREFASPYLVADSAHTLGDSLVTGLALVSLVLSSAGLGRVDGALGIAVALVMAWSGVQIIRRSVPMLVDARAIDGARLAAVIGSTPGVAGVRSARSRSTASGDLFVDATITVDGALSVERAHAVADAVEAAVDTTFGATQVAVHVEPS